MRNKSNFPYYTGRRHCSDQCEVTRQEWSLPRVPDTEPRYNRLQHPAIMQMTLHYSTAVITTHNRLGLVEVTRIPKDWFYWLDWKGWLKCREWFITGGDLLGSLIETRWPQICAKWEVWDSVNDSALGVHKSWKEPYWIRSVCIIRSKENFILTEHILYLICNFLLAISFQSFKFQYKSFQPILPH